jgi:flagellar export protein FliJ
MKRFRFPLEAALALRQRAVEEQEVLFRAVRAEWDAQQRKIDELDAEIRSETDAASNPEVSAADLAALDLYRGAALRRKDRYAREAQELAQRLDFRRSELHRCERDRELLVRLKDKALARWNKEYEKEQDALAEEAYLSRWATR